MPSIVPTVAACRLLIERDCTARVSFRASACLTMMLPVRFEPAKLEEYTAVECSSVYYVGRQFSVAIIACTFFVSAFFRLYIFLDRELAARSQDESLKVRYSFKKPVKFSEICLLTLEKTSYDTTGHSLSTKLFTSRHHTTSSAPRYMTTIFVGSA